MLVFTFHWINQTAQRDSLQGSTMSCHSVLEPRDCTVSAALKPHC
jgi:hypothetical protein